MTARKSINRTVRMSTSPEREKMPSSFVRQHRKLRGLTQRQLAELAGVGPRAVFDMERGKVTLRMDVANAVLGVFGKTLGVQDAPRPVGDE
ncbi:MAG: helix-turn-helix domain-containing protein, partial [Myxococcaceae bacterium]